MESEADKDVTHINRYTLTHRYTMLQWQREWYAGLVESHAGILAERGDYEVTAERASNC